MPVSPRSIPNMSAWHVRTPSPTSSSPRSILPLPLPGTQARSGLAGRETPRQVSWRTAPSPPATSAPRALLPLWWLPWRETRTGCRWRQLAVWTRVLQQWLGRLSSPGRWSLLDSASGTASTFRGNIYHMIQCEAKNNKQMIPPPPPKKSQNLCSFCVTKIWDVNTDWRKSAVGCGKKHTLSYTYSGTFCFLRTSKQNQAKVVLKQRQGRGFSRQGCLPSAVQLQLYHAHTVHAISKSSHGICGPPRPTGGADPG